MVAPVPRTACAATFGTLIAGSHGLRGLGQLSAGFLSGLPAGALSAELSSVLSGKGHASLQAIAESAYGFAVVGATLGIVHMADARAKSSGDAGHQGSLGAAEPGEINETSNAEIVADAEASRRCRIWPAPAPE